MNKPITLLLSLIASAASGQDATLLELGYNHIDEGVFEATIYGVEKMTAAGEKDLLEFIGGFEHHYNAAQTIGAEGLPDILITDLEISKQYIDQEAVTGKWFTTLMIGATLACTEVDCNVASATRHHRQLMTGELQDVSEQVLAQLVEKREYFQDVDCLKIYTMEAGFYDDSGEACEQYRDEPHMPSESRRE